MKTIKVNYSKINNGLNHHHFDCDDHDFDPIIKMSWSNHHYNIIVSMLENPKTACMYIKNNHGWIRRQAKRIMRMSRYVKYKIVEADK